MEGYCYLKITQDHHLVSRYVHVSFLYVVAHFACHFMRDSRGRKTQTTTVMFWAYFNTPLNPFCFIGLDTDRSVCDGRRYLFECICLSSRNVDTPLDGEFTGKCVANAYVDNGQ